VSVRHVLFIILLSLTLVPVSSAKEGCVRNVSGEVICASPGGSCMQNIYGQVLCSKPGGGIIKNGTGEILCGPGKCVRDGIGDVYCSSEPEGGAALNGLGQAVCVGGCVKGSASYCETPRPAN
jgi:hypothetical protein